MEISRALAELDMIRRNLLKEQDRILAELKAIDREIEGLERVVHRLGPRAAQDSLHLDTLSMMEMARTDAIERIITRSREPLSPADIMARLHAEGRDDEYNVVSAALAYLAKKDRVHSVGRGQWMAGPEPKRGTDSARFTRPMRTDGSWVVQANNVPHVVGKSKGRPKGKGVARGDGT